MSDLGLICALPREARAFTRARGPGPHPLPAGELIVSGIGARRAGEAAQALVARGARCLVSFGLCAGLDERLRPGQVVVATQVLDAGARPVPCDGRWRAALLETLGTAPAPTGAIIAHAPQVLVSPADKARVRRATGGAAADMESAAVAAAARAHDVPLVALRVVFDDARTTLPPALLAALDGYGRLRPRGLPTLLRADVVRRLPALLRASRAADAGLARAAAALAQLAAGPPRVASRRRTGL